MLSSKGKVHSSAAKGPSPAGGIWNGSNGKEGGASRSGGGGAAWGWGNDGVGGSELQSIAVTDGLRGDATDASGVCVFGGGLSVCRCLWCGCVYGCVCVYVCVCVCVYTHSLSY